jgi:chorismate mutase/prephenate dehydratase
LATDAGRDAHEGVAFGSMANDDQSRNALSKLGELRTQIDAVDEQILALLERRAATVEQVAEVKREAGLASFYDPERERAVLDRVSQKGAGAFPRDAIRSVFREIMSGCLSLESPITVAFLGPEGTFSHMAARHLFGLAARYREASTIHGVLDAVRRGDALSGVVPVENSTDGSVTSSLDALGEADLLIRQELIFEVSYCLLSRAGSMSSISRVYGTAQALEHCRIWLTKHVGEAQIVQTSSTSAAAREAAADDRIAAIGNKLAADLFGLAIASEDIQDHPDHATRFVVLATADAPRTGLDKTTLAFSLPDAGARGALKRVLEVFDTAGVNICRIESRPRSTKTWEYLFWVDVEGHRVDPAVASLIDQLQARCQIVKVLGSYPRHETR